MLVVLKRFGFIGPRDISYGAGRRSLARICHMSYLFETTITIKACEFNYLFLIVSFLGSDFMLMDQRVFYMNQLKNQFTLLNHHLFTPYIHHRVLVIFLYSLLLNCQIINLQALFQNPFSFLAK